MQTERAWKAAVNAAVVSTYLHWEVIQAPPVSTAVQVALLPAVVACVRIVLITVQEIR